MLVHSIKTEYRTTHGTRTITQLWQFTVCAETLLHTKLGKNHTKISYLFTS